MTTPLSLFFLLSILSSAVFAISSGESEDIGIRQVVDEVVSDLDELILNAEHHFTNFRTKYGKTYADEAEHAHRFSVFKSNLHRAKRHQIIDPTAVHGITQFSDLTPAEFKNNYLGLRRLKLPADAHKAPILPTNGLPDDFDWRDRGAVTPVKNQVHD